jgi:hypothetical protein
MSRDGSANGGIAEGVIVLLSNRTKLLLLPARIDGPSSAANSVMDTRGSPSTWHSQFGRAFEVILAASGFKNS